MINFKLPSILRFHRRQKGQVLVLVALFMGVLLGMTAMAIDVGAFLADRRDMQNAADAIALAASQELPDEAAVQQVANEWALNNGIDPATMTVTITQQSLPTEPNPKVRVQLQDAHGFIFAKVIGITEADINVAAAAIRTSPAGGDNTIPLSVTETVVDGATFGEQVTIKYDANNILQGNAGPVRIDGPGSGDCNITNFYCTGIEYGSDNVVCAEGADSTYCDGPYVVDTQPGNLVGPTRTAIDYRINNTDSHCDTFEEVFQDDPTSSDSTVYAFDSDCNPFVASRYSSLRVVIIPVIEELCNGSCEVRIVDFALLFIEGYGNGNENQGHGQGQGVAGCTGNECEVVGRLVRVHQNIGMLAGTFDPTAFNTFVRLVE
jgi:Flp pilus assembly protein TadG